MEENYKDLYRNISEVIKITESLEKREDLFLDDWFSNKNYLNEIYKLMDEKKKRDFIVSNINSLETNELNELYYKDRENPKIEQEIMVF